MNVWIKNFFECEILANMSDTKKTQGAFSSGRHDEIIRWYNKFVNTVKNKGFLIYIFRMIRECMLELNKNFLVKWKRIICKLIVRYNTASRRQDDTNKKSVPKGLSKQKSSWGTWPWIQSTSEFQTLKWPSIPKVKIRVESGEKQNEEIREEWPIRDCTRLTSENEPDLKIIAHTRNSKIIFHYDIV